MLTRFKPGDLTILYVAMLVTAIVMACQNIQDIARFAVMPCENVGRFRYQYCVMVT